METETALLWGFVVLLLVVLATILALLVHSGIFIHVDVKTCKPDIGELFIAYKFARGPYKESGALFTQMHTLLPEYKTVGVYYDDPKMKQPQKLRYIVGLILAEDGSPVNMEDKRLLEEHGYQFATFPAIDHAVQTSFPFNSTISIIVAVMKVYPALSEYVEARSLCARPFLEVYDNKKSELLFVGPLARQDDFYVPEVLLDEESDHQNDYDDDDRTENSSRSWNESGSFVRDDAADNPTPAPSSTLASTPTPSPSEMMPPPPTPPPVAPTPTPPASPAKSPPTPPSSPPTPPAAEAMPPPQVSAPESMPPPQVPAPESMPPPPFPAPIPAPPLMESAEATDTAESGSQGGEESDANTGSSFEEIDEREAATALLGDAGTPAGGKQEAKKDEDEGER